MKKEILEKITDDDERVGAETVLKALIAPLQQLAKNAGLNGGAIVKKVWMDGCMGGWVDEYLDVWVDVRCMNQCMFLCMYGWMDMYFCFNIFIS